MKIKIITIAVAWALIFSSSQEKLRDINLEIQKLTDQLAASRQEKASILNDIYTLELEIDVAAIEVNKLNLLLADTQEKIDLKHKEEAVLKEKIARSQENVRRILRVLYKMGELGYVKLFINIGNLDQLFRNYRLIVALMDDRVVEIKAIRQGIARLQKIKHELKTEFDRLSGLKGEKAAKLVHLNELKQNKLAVISKINRQRDLNARLLEELKEEELKLTDFLNQKSGSPAADKVNFSSLRGKLAWPLQGDIISAFGKKKSSRFNTYTFNNGIEIKPLHAEEIKAVHGGEIIFCDYFKGYGNLLIIQHPGNFHSLYGHCEKFFKKSGEQVEPGETIALAGNSGSLYGKSLYFEIRQNLKPQDPLSWLEKK
ncbi:MAG: peptidoglycan DD-metalloendopeptidase family protein [Candidatus Aminicenantes bacterium]|nr:peptidoglycan DD-metalloendopeptidase family protein [Candidatus Aminicenantes bacterium]